MIWVGCLSIYGFSGPWRCMCKFWNQKSLKFGLSQSADRMLKTYLYLYIVILKSYQTAIQYMGNVTLSFIKRHDVGPFQKYTILQLKLLACVCH